MQIVLIRVEKVNDKEADADQDATEPAANGSIEEETQHN